jgi:predicted transcriptional regulator
LAALAAPTSASEPEPKKGLVSVRASIKPDHLVCMECGALQKMLKRHLAVAHGMSPDQYRADYGLPATYPMSAPNYSEQRRALAKSLGLGRKPAAAEDGGSRKKGGGRRTGGRGAPSAN